MERGMEPETRWVRAKLTGMLMQSFREQYTINGRKGRLTQDDMLLLMGQVDPRYSGTYDRSTVSKWETGKVLPTRERLEVFGKALKLQPAEIEGLMALSGLEARDEAESPAVAGAAASVRPVEDRAATDANGIPSYAWEAIKFSLSRFFLPGFLIAGVGFYLASLGWNTAWVLLTYISSVIGLMMFGAFLRIRRPDNLRELYFLSVFVLLSTPMFQAPLTRMDPYGFYSIGGIANTPIPFLLAFLANLILALVAGLMFDYLWKVQYHGSGSAINGAYARAHWVVLPPLVVVYGIAIVFCNTQTWVYLTIVFPILDAVFTVLAVLRDRDTSLGAWSQKTLLGAAVAVLIFLSAIGVSGTLMFYWEPSLLAVPDHNLFRSWEIDFHELGYPPEELYDRLRVGVAWASLASLGFVVVFIGGHLLAAIQRTGGGGSANTSPALVPSAPAVRRRRQPNPTRAAAHYPSGWLGDHRIPQPVRSSAGHLYY